MSIACSSPLLCPCSRYNAADSSLSVVALSWSPRSKNTYPKSLSGNRHLGEDELGAGEVDERQVVLGLLLPTHQQPPRAVQPRMRPLHYPTPRSCTGVPASLHLSLSALVLLGGAYVGLVAPRR